jgi:membrane protease YdiL (CAAX protease family)
VYLAGQPSSTQQIVFTAGKSLQFAFPLVWVYWFHRHRLTLARPARNWLIVGVVFGLVIAAAMLALYFLVLAPGGWLAGADQAVRDKLTHMGLNTLPMFLGAAIFYSIIHSLLEEYYWRWFVFGELRELVSVGAAVIISSLGFTAHHVILLGIYLGWQSPLTYLFAAAIAIGGAVWAWIYHRSGTLYANWAAHLLVDAAIFVIGYDLARAIL